MKNRFSRQSGLLSLEACIVVTLFLFLMLFLYSFFVVFEARNEIGHVLLSTADSLALDPFANESMADPDSLQGIIYGIYGSMSSGNGTFFNTEKWYEDETLMAEEIRNRFLAYLAERKQSDAQEVLKRLHVVDGPNGLDFSKSKLDGDELKLVVEYEINYEFQLFGFKGAKFSQSCSSKLWK